MATKKVGGVFFHFEGESQALVPHEGSNFIGREEEEKSNKGSERAALFIIPLFRRM